MSTARKMRRGEAGLGRREKALQTRRRMLEAAYRVFCRRGLAGTTLAAIAEEAGVAVQTLYFTFHTKGAVLAETLGACIVGFDEWDPRVERELAMDQRRAFTEVHEWYRDFEGAKTAGRALEVFVEASLEVFARAGPLWPAITAAAFDPEVKVTAEVAERRRAEGYRLVVEQLAAKGGLRAGLTLSRATDVLLTVASAETYLQLTAGRGWRPAECGRWLREVLTQQLFPPAPGRVRRRRVPA